MRLICKNEDCEHTCADYEAAGPYVAPECPKCWSPMEEFIPPTPRFLGATLRNAVDGGEYMEAVVETAPAAPAFPVPNLRIRQAS